MDSPTKPYTPKPSPLLELPPFSTTSTSRFQSLYSGFARQKQSNPASYNSNIDWWTRALEVVVSSGIRPMSSNRLVLSAGQSLLEDLRVAGAGKPLGLHAVVSELRQSKSFIPVETFLSSTPSVYDPGWLPLRIVSFVVGKPLWWALEQLGVIGDDATTQSNAQDWWGEYVVLSLVERAADRVLELLNESKTSPADSIFDMDSFRGHFSSVLSAEGSPMSQLDSQVLLKYLERDRRVVVTSDGVIKFVDQGAEIKQITSVDHGILELKNAVRNLHTQITGLQRKMAECAEKASAALQQKQKSVALSYLRSKKQLSEVLERRLGSLQMLEGTLLRVESAAGDIEILKSYQSSTETLRSILSHPSLQRERVDETMDALAEANADAKDISDAIQAGSVAGEMIDETEIEDELAALVLDVEMEAVSKKLANAQLDVPRAGPENEVVAGAPAQGARSAEAVISPS